MRAKLMVKLIPHLCDHLNKTQCPSVRRQKKKTKFNLTGSTLIPIKNRKSLLGTFAHLNHLNATERLIYVWRKQNQVDVQCAWSFHQIIAIRLKNTWFGILIVIYVYESLLYRLQTRWSVGRSSTTCVPKPNACIYYISTVHCLNWSLNACAALWRGATEDLF